MTDSKWGVFLLFAQDGEDKLEDDEDAEKEKAIAMAIAAIHSHIHSYP